MFKLLKNNKGQGVTVQYALTFFFIVAAITSMTVYFKRTLQGRIRDATLYMAKTVHNVYTGNIHVQYEPYYMETAVDSSAVTDQFEELLPSFNATSGIAVTGGSTETTSKVSSEQARPGLGD